MSATRSPWPRVSREYPCPICGKPDQCKRSPDGGAVLCARVQSARRCGYGWLHRLADSRPSFVDRPPLELPPVAPRAADSDLDRVYRAILCRLPLDSRHRDHLHGRGLADADVDRAVYRSLPAGPRYELGRKLRDLFPDCLLSTVPGVIARNGKHGRYLTIVGAPGIVIPVRSAAGHVVGLVMRPDDPGDSGKYRWLSSSKNGGRDGKPSPGARVHVPVWVSTRPRVVVVEGGLKADVAAALSGRSIIGLPGCVVNPEAIATLRALGAEEALLALDADAAANPRVARAQLEGLHRLKAAGFVEGLVRWDSTLGKGLDDALLTLAGRTGT